MFTSLLIKKILLIAQLKYDHHKSAQVHKVQAFEFYKSNYVSF